MSILRIAIIGAGPGGLTLARILQKNGMECSLFELDQDRYFRDQGGIVDLHPQSGQLALQEAGVFEDFQKFSLPEAESQKLIKSNGTIFWDENNTKNTESGYSRNKPEIERAALRDILLDATRADSISWNRRLLSVEPSEACQDKYDIQFADGREKGFDLVVGADGAWSKVRLLLTDQLPIYSGVTIIELMAKDVSVKKQWLTKFTGHGSCFMFDEGRALICQQNGRDSIRIYAAVRQSESWVIDCGINWNDRNTAQEIFAERYFGDCHEDLKRVVATEASDGLITRPLYMLPVGFRWEPRHGLTLIGDAAHLMTPFGGVGVNVALSDALDLAKALLKRKASFHIDLPGNLDSALREYEEPMFERAKMNMEKTWVGLQHHFSENGIDERVKRLKAIARQIEQQQTLERHKRVERGEEGA